MVLKKQNPVGLDIYIQGHEQALHDYCKKVWHLRNEHIKAYGCVYRNATDNGYIPEFYDGNGNYKETLLDSSIPLQFFYGESTTPERIINPKQFAKDIHLVVMLNLEEIKKGIKHRADREVYVDMIEFLKVEMFGMKLTSGVIKGVQRVYEEYTGMAQESLKYKSDMHPWHSFRFNLECQYVPNIGSSKVK